MSVTAARVVRGEAAARAERVVPEQPRAAARVLRREILQAQEQAYAMLQEARAKAQSITEQAQAQASQQAQQALQGCRAQAQEEVAAAWVALRAREARSDAAALERTIAIARLLAERVLHQQLRLAPEMMVPMAREAVAQFWRAEAIVVHGCASDLEVLRAHSDQLGVSASVLRFEADDGCRPGSVRVRTPQGSLDADLCLQLDRLVEALR